MRVTSRMRSWIEMQGFAGLSDRTISQIYYWLRMAPLVCGVWTAIGIGLESAAVIWTLVPFAAAGAIGPRHPFDVVYALVRRRLGSDPLPRYRAPRRFACGLATLLLVVTGWSLQEGKLELARAAGGSLVLIAGVQVASGFCLPSFLVRLMEGATSRLGKDATTRAQPAGQSHGRRSRNVRTASANRSGHS